MTQPYTNKARQYKSNVEKMIKLIRIQLGPNDNPKPFLSALRRPCKSVFHVIAPLLKVKSFS